MAWPYLDGKKLKTWHSRHSRKKGTRIGTKMQPSAPKDLVPKFEASCMQRDASFVSSEWRVVHGSIPGTKSPIAKQGRYHFGLLCKQDRPHVHMLPYAQLNFKTPCLRRIVERRCHALQHRQGLCVYKHRHLSYPHFPGMDTSFAGAKTVVSVILIVWDGCEDDMEGSTCPRTEHCATHTYRKISGCAGFNACSSFDETVRCSGGSNAMLVNQGALTKRGRVCRKPRLHSAGFRDCKQ